MGYQVALIGNRPVHISDEDVEAYMSASSDEERDAIKIRMLAADDARRRIAALYDGDIPPEGFRV